MNKLVESAVDSDKCPHCGLSIQAEEREQSCSCPAAHGIVPKSFKSLDLADDWSDIT